MAIKIFIDQGHNPTGFPNAGATGFGLFEQDVTFQIGIYLADLLRTDPRFEVMVSRPTPQTVLGTTTQTSLNERVRMANAWPADYFISLHTNANVNPAIRGTEVYVFRQFSEAYWFGERILLSIVRNVGTVNNGLRTANFYVLRRTTMPAVLVELAYITNPDDNQLLRNNQYQFAYAIYLGILDYFGLRPV